MVRVTTRRRRQLPFDSKARKITLSCPSVGSEEGRWPSRRRTEGERRAKALYWLERRTDATHDEADTINSVPISELGFAPRPLRQGQTSKAPTHSNSFVALGVSSLNGQCLWMHTLLHAESKIIFFLMLPLSCPTPVQPKHVL